jgi:glycosyltransferase involved in cell wall biosynthesis
MSLLRVLMICPELPTEKTPGSMAPGARQIQSIVQAGVDVEIVDMRGIPKLKYLQVIPKVRRALRSVNVVHAHFGYCGWLALLGRKLAMRRVPIVISFMGDDLLGTPLDELGTLQRSSLIAARINCRMAKRYDQVIVKSAEMSQRLGTVPCHVIPNGVDLDSFRPQARHEARGRLGWSVEGLRVLFPGNPANPRKGHGLAKAAVSIAGQSLGQTIELIPLWGVKPEWVATYMNACDAMLMTSLIEGSPNVVKEALGCNANVIAVPVGDVHDMLYGVEHCVCTSREAPEIAKALVHVLRQAQASNGRDVLRQRGLSLEGVARQIISVYEQALAGRDARQTVAPAKPAET